MLDGILAVPTISFVQYVFEDKKPQKRFEEGQEYWKHQQSRNDEEGLSTDKLDPFASLTDLVEPLQDYIENRTEERVPALKQVISLSFWMTFWVSRARLSEEGPAPQELGATCQKCS